MADMDALTELRRPPRPAVIEDAAQAHGARRGDGRSRARWRRVGCFSFYPGKNLGAFGDAGAVVTDDADVADRQADARPRPSRSQSTMSSSASTAASTRSRPRFCR